MVHPPPRFDVARRPQRRSEAAEGLGGGLSHASPRTAPRSSRQGPVCAAARRPSPPSPCCPSAWTRAAALAAGVPSRARSAGSNTGRHSGRDSGRRPRAQWARGPFPRSPVPPFPRSPARRIAFPEAAPRGAARNAEAAPRGVSLAASHLGAGSPGTGTGPGGARLNQAGRQGRRRGALQTCAGPNTPPTAGPRRWGRRRATTARKRIKETNNAAARARSRRNNITPPPPAATSRGWAGRTIRTGVGGLQGQ